LPALFHELVSDFQAHRQNGETFSTFFDRMGETHFKGLVARHAGIPAYSERPEFYRDFGTDEDFSLAGRGAGECGSGVFELIQEELTAARKAKEPFDTVLSTTRGLLITRGVDAQDPDTVFREFEKHFLDTGLVAEEFRPLLSRARGYSQGWQQAFDGYEEAVGKLLERVELLYSTLDANLEFHPPEGRDMARRNGGESPAPDTAVELDLRGVACPMNFVKSKLRLESMDVGETLAIVLDDGEPIRNVPASFRNEGQTIEETTDLGDGHWRVTVRKTK
jgi:sulfite reductase (ferredoxin)